MDRQTEEKQKIVIKYIIKTTSYTPSVKKACKKYYNQNKDVLQYKANRYYYNVKKPMMEEFRRLCQIEI